MKCVVIKYHTADSKHYKYISKTLKIGGLSFDFTKIVGSGDLVIAEISESHLENSLAIAARSA